MKPCCLRLAMTSAHSLFTLIATCPSVFAQPAPDVAALDALLVRMNASAMRYQGHLPDFTCTEVTVRKEDRSGNGVNWRTMDTLEELVSFASNGRVSKTLVKKNGRPTTRNTPGGLIENAVLSGAIVPRGIFGAKAQPKFDWDHWETRSEHRIAVIAYHAVGENYPDGKPATNLKVTGRIIFDSWESGPHGIVKCGAAGVSFRRGSGRDGLRSGEHFGPRIDPSHQSSYDDRPRQRALPERDSVFGLPKVSGRHHDSVR